MGYVLPAIPDSLLETMKHRPSHTKAVKRLEQTEPVTSIQYHQAFGQQKRKPDNHPYKGRYIDRYV